MKRSVVVPDMVEATAVGFALLGLASLVVLARSLRRILDSPRPTLAPRPEAPPADPDAPWLRREVLDEEGMPQGETVAVDQEADAVVVRRMLRYHLVPRSRMRLEDDTVRVQGVDWAEAEAGGEAWERAHPGFLEADDPILHRSRRDAPAREAEDGTGAGKEDEEARRAER